MSKSSEPSPNTDLPFTKGGNYRGLRFEKRDFSGSTLQEVDLTQTVLIDASFQNSTLTSCTLDAVQARGISCQKAKFISLRAQYGDFEDSSFEQTTLTEAHLARANFFAANLSGADLQKANLSGADLRRANLSGANLTGANLSGADLANADLTDAILDNVFVKQTRITQTQGLSEEKREQLFAAGAYEGLPPGISKIGIWSKNTAAQIGEQAKSVQEWLSQRFGPDDEGTFFERLQKSYEQWQERKEEQNTLRKQEEEDWKKRQEEERKARKQRRLRREIERKSVAQRKKDNQEIRSSLLEQQKEREKMRRDLARKIREQMLSLQDPKEDFSPHEHPKAIELELEANNLYQRSEELGKQEDTLRAELLKDPQNYHLAEELKLAEEKTQTVAQQALNAQEKYTAFIEEQKALHLTERRNRQWETQKEIERLAALQERLNAQSDIYSEQLEDDALSLHEEISKALAQEEKQELQERREQEALAIQQEQEREREQEEKEKNQALRDQLLYFANKAEALFRKRKERAERAQALIEAREREEKAKKEVQAQLQKLREARKRKEQADLTAQQIAQSLQSNLQEQEKIQEEQRKKEEEESNILQEKIALQEQQAAEDLQAELQQRLQDEEERESKAKEQASIDELAAFIERSATKADEKRIREQQKSEDRRRAKEAQEKALQEEAQVRQQAQEALNELRKARRRKEEADQAALRIAQEIKKQQETIDTVVQKNRTWRDWFRAFYLDPASDERVLDAVEKAQEEISLSLMRQAEIAQEEQALLFTQELEQEKQAQQQKDQEKQKAKNEKLRAHLQKLAAAAEEEEILFEEFPQLEDLIFEEQSKIQNEEFELLLERYLEEEALRAKSDTQQKLAADQFSLDIAAQIREELEAERKKQQRIALRSQQAQALEERRERRKERLEQREDHLAKAKAELAQELALSRMDAGEQRAQLERETTQLQNEETMSQVALIKGENLRFQRTWYRFTDSVSRYSIPVASRLDAVKEQIEEQISARRAAAYRKRERQRREQQRALEEQRQQEHKERIRRLTLLRAKEEERILEYKKQEQERIQELADKEQKQQLRTLSTELRHDYYRSFAPSVIVDHREKDLRGANLLLSNWPKALLSRSLLQATQLSMSNLMEADLRQASLDGSRLDEATLDGALMEKATLIGTSLQHASLLGAQLRLTRLIEADVRYADFSGANLQDSDLSGCDARHASFAGANLHRAQLMGARFHKASFRGANLQGAIFHQSLLSDVDLQGADVQGADFSGASGLTEEQLKGLLERGARIDDLSSMTSALGVSQLRAAVFLFGLALMSYLFTTYITAPKENIAQVEAELQLLSDQDPKEASIQYEELAQQSTRSKDKVGYLIEASSLSTQVRDLERAEELLVLAMSAADENKELKTKVQLQLCRFYNDRKRAEDVLPLATTLIDNSTIGASERARLLLMIEDAAKELESDTAEIIEPLNQYLEQSAAIEADFRMALAEARTERGDPIAAIAEIDKAEQREHPIETQLRLLEARARVQERGGDFLGALDTLSTLQERSEKNSLSWQSALLSMADIYQREDEPDKATDMLNTLLNAQLDARLRGRAYLIEGRVFEQQDQFAKAIESYQKGIDLPDAEPETKEEARLSLARVLLEIGETEQANLLVDLPPMAIAQARLGEARRKLDSNQAEDALGIYTELLADSSLDDGVHRAAKAGSAEALSAMGSFEEAERLWRTLLAQELPKSERNHIEVLLAYGMLQGGDTQTARTAFRSLSQAEDTEIRLQGLLGLAETARNLGEKERAKELYRQVIDESKDNAFSIQAWRELALIASEQQNSEDVLLAWNAINQLSKTTNENHTHATLSIITALSDLGRVQEAQEICLQDTQSTESMLSCALIFEENNPQQATQLYQRVLQDEEIALDFRAEAALGLARHTQEATWIQEGLSLNSKDAATQFQLLSLAIAEPSFATQREAFIEQRSQLSQKEPVLFAQALLDSANRLRQSNDGEKAVSELEEALSLDLPTESISIITLELADIYLEQNQFSKAQEKYQSLQNGEETKQKFDANMGLARALYHQNKFDEAIETLKATTPSSTLEEQRKTELLAQIQTAQEKPEALELWSSYAQNAQDNPEIQYQALIGQAQIKLAADEADEAQKLYKQASMLKVEDSQQSWARLGLAQALIEGGNTSKAELLLEQEQQNSDAEVSMQAFIAQAQLALRQEQPQKTLSILENIQAQSLGPAWDASLEEMRASAYVALDDEENAIKTLQSLADRWPQEEEAILPALLGLADIHRGQENREDALVFAQRALSMAQDENYRSRAQSFIDTLQ